MDYCYFENVQYQYFSFHIGNRCNRLMFEVTFQPIGATRDKYRGFDVFSESRFLLKCECNVIVSSTDQFAFDALALMGKTLKSKHAKLLKFAHIVDAVSHQH